ncbi:hypothetical protein MHK_000172 [Candidatus Magnetomorum sp. HK-1]|nr:hypothetical protein MHK_000172 [Candidatus Magnetomorum sp. HK-1]
MLDVFASSMGAFLIIMVVLLPYYKKDAQLLMEQLQQQQEQTRQLQQKVKQHQEQIQKQQLLITQQKTAIQNLEKKKKNLEDQLKNTFLIVVMNWKTSKHDIDLHVIDPKGNEFYFSKKKIAGVNGELSEDTKNGPGVEVWEIPKAAPGKYKVYYKFYSKHSNKRSSEVNGRVYYRDGSKKFRKIVLRNEKEKPLVATITVKNDGQVIIH